MNKLILFLSRRNWAIVRYNSIFRNLNALLYLCIASETKDLSFLASAALFFLFSILMTAYGYFVNDLADIDIDRQHGKPNAFLNYAPGRSKLIVVGILAIGIVFSLPFINDIQFLVVLVFWILMSTFYSLRPIRFKERGVWGLVATVLAEYTLPIVLLFAAFHQAVSWAALIFTLYSTIRGTAANVSHQLKDWSKDVTTNTTTFVVRSGYSFARGLYPFVLEVERVSLGAVIGIFFVEDAHLVATFSTWTILLIWPVAVIYLGLLFLTFGRSYQALHLRRLEAFDPYDEDRQVKIVDALHLIHHSLPSVLMPLYLACIAALFYWPNLVFVVMIVLVFRLYSPEFLAKFHPRNYANSH